MEEIPRFLSSLAQLETTNIETLVQKSLEKTLARSACRSSVMSGEKISDEEAIILWQKIKNEEQGATCPHGRPVMVELSRKEVDKLFFRDGF